MTRSKTRPTPVAAHADVQIMPEDEVSQDHEAAQEAADWQEGAEWERTAQAQALAAPPAEAAEEADTPMPDATEETESTSPTHPADHVTLAPLPEPLATLDWDATLPRIVAAYKALHPFLHVADMALAYSERDPVDPQIARVLLAVSDADRAMGVALVGVGALPACTGFNAQTQECRWDG